MISFKEYAKEWLYGADGYYAKAPIVGKKGDFFTSVSTSRFFGGAIANHLIGRIKSGALPNDITVCEVGAHQGYLIADIVQFIYTLDANLLKSISFAIVEPQPKLREIQTRYLFESFGDEVKFAHYDSLNDIEADQLFLYANELFDAFAFDLIDHDKMAFVSDHKIVWQPNTTPFKSRGEYFADFEVFAQSIRATKCEAIFFDYGEFSPRNDFSARIYQNHTVSALFEHESFEEFYKQADLTADVPFDQLKNAFEARGFVSDQLKTQSVALVEMGILELLEIFLAKAGIDAYQKEVGNIRALLDPAMLGERFKMARFVLG